LGSLENFDLKEKIEELKFQLEHEQKSYATYKEKYVSLEKNRDKHLADSNRLSSECDDL
jgi:cell division septum initiation protein DivIVA